MADTTLRVTGPGTPGDEDLKYLPQVSTFPVSSAPNFKQCSGVSLPGLSGSRGSSADRAARDAAHRAHAAAARAQRLPAVAGLPLLVSGQLRLHHLPHLLLRVELLVGRACGSGRAGKEWAQRRGRGGAQGLRLPRACINASSPRLARQRWKRRFRLGPHPSSPPPTRARPRPRPAAAPPAPPAAAFGGRGGAGRQAGTSGKQSARVGGGFTGAAARRPPHRAPPPAPCRRRRLWLPAPWPRCARRACWRASGCRPAPGGGGGGGSLPCEEVG